MKYDILSSVTVDGTITQVLVRNLTEELCAWICDTREQSIKEALVQLGWTPPKEKTHNERGGRYTKCLDPDTLFTQGL